MTDKDKIRNIIELFIAWNGETEAIDVANIEAAVEYIDSIQEEPKYKQNNYSKEPVSTKDKLTALSDGKLHLGWLDDARKVEFEECMEQFYSARNTLPTDLDGISRIRAIDDIIHHYSKELLSIARGTSTSVWHGASEKPDEGRDFSFADCDDVVWSRYRIEDLFQGWESFVNTTGMTKWAYTSDILKL